jgi:hypothetical protein
MMRQPTIFDVIAHDHVDDLQRRARKARLAAKAARRQTVRSTRRNSR